MIYLDYSATTPVNKEVLDSFTKTCLMFPGNPNSLHKLGVETNELIKSATDQIRQILKLKNQEIIYTSGASESNNLAIKGVGLKYQSRGKHIITTDFEHSSIYGPLSYLQSLGFEIDIAEVDEYGRVDLIKLEQLIRDDTILISIAAVNSEIGIIQPIEEIANLLKKYPKCFFHVDMTQSITKININLNDIDFVSFSAHKFFGLKGIGCLIKNKKVRIEPLIHGGKSTTIYRSGTPAAPLIVSTSKALRLANANIEKKFNHVKNLNNNLKDFFKQYEHIKINSNEFCSPYILNISVLGIKPETFMHALETKDIYISTQTACAKDSSLSRAVLSLTKDEERAKSSLRISLAYLTTENEINTFIEEFKTIYDNLSLLRR